MNEFMLKIMAALDTKGISADYNKLKQMLEKDPAKINTIMNMSASKTEVNKFIKEYAPKLQEMFANAGVKGINIKDIEASMKTVFNESEKLTKQQIANQKKLYLDTEQAYKTNANMRIASEKQVQAEAIKAAKASQDAFNLKSGKVQLDNRISSYLRDNSKLSGELKNRLVELQKQISNVDKVGLNNLHKNFKEVTSDAKALGQTGDSVFGRLQKNTVQFLNYLGSATVIMTGVNTVRNLISSVEDLDKSLVDIQQATGYAADEAKELLITYIDLGQELGATGIEVANSAGMWLRQGKSIAETNQLIKDSMILSKVGQIDSAQATQYLTSAMKGYKVEVSDVLGIVDKLSAIDLSSATDVAGLAEAMSRVANMANLTGVSMDKLLSYLATVGEVTQKDMASIGTSFQTMFARMGNIKIGKFVDDESGENLNDVETILDKFGIKLRDDEKSFRNFGDVLDDIGSKWDTYSSVEKNAIGVAVSGVRQRENFTVLMENYSKSLDYTKISAESSGIAMEKFAAYENSVEAKTKTLQASLQELAIDTLDSSVIKSFLDLSNSLVNITDEIGIFNIAIIALTGYLGANTALGLTNFANSLYVMATNMGIATGTATTLSMALSTILPVLGGMLVIKGITTAFNAYNDTVEESKSKIAELTASMKSLQPEYDTLSKKQDLTEYEKNRLDYLERRLELDQKILDIETKQMYQNLIGTKANDVFDNDSLLAQKFQEENKRKKGSYENLNYQMGGDLSDLDKYTAKIQELENANKNLSKSSQEYKDNQKEINSLTEKQTDAYDKLSKFQDDLITKQGKFLDFANQSDEAIASGLLKGDELKQAQEMSDHWHGLYDEVTKTLNIIGYASSEASDKVEDVAETMANATASGVGGFDISVYSDQFKDLQSNISTAQSALDKLKAGNLSDSDVFQLMQDLPSVIPYIDMTADGFGNLEQGLSDIANINIDNIIALLEGAKTGASNEDILNIDKTIAAVKAMSSGFGESTKSLSDWQERLSSVNSSISTLKDILAEVNGKDYTNLSTSSLNTIINQYPQLLAYIGDEKRLREELNKVIGEEEEKSKLAYANMVAGERAKLNAASDVVNGMIKGSSTLVNELGKAYKVDLSNFESIVQAKAKLEEELIKNSASAWAQYYKVQVDASTGLATVTAKDTIAPANMEGFKNAVAQEGAANAAAGAYNKAINSLNSIVNGIDIKTSAGLSKSDKSKSSAKQFTGAIDNSLHSIDKLETKISEFKKTMDESDPYSVQIKDINALIKLQDKLAKGYDKQAKTYESKFKTATKGLNSSYVNQIKNGTKFNIQSFNGNEKLYNKVTTAQDWYEKWQDSLINAKDTRREITENKSEVVKLKIEADFEKVDKQVEKKTKELSETNQALDLVNDGSIEQLTLFQTGYKLASEKAKLLSDEIAKLNKQYKQGKIDEKTYSDRLDDLSSGLGDSVSEIQSFRDSILDYMRDYYDEKKELLEDNQKDELDALEKVHDATIKSLNEQIDKYRKIVEAKKESLQATEDEYQHQKKIKELTDNISKIQSDLTDASKDNSREGKQRQRELQNELAKANQDLTDTQHDYQVDSEMDAQDKALKNFEDIMDDKIRLEDEAYDRDVANINSKYDIEIQKLTERYDTEEQLILDAADLTKQSFSEAWNSISELMKSNFLTMSDGFKSSFNSTSPSSISNNSSTGVGIGASIGTANKSSAVFSILENANGTGQGTSDLNKYVTGKGFGVLSYNNMAALASVLGLDIDAKDARDEANQKKILSKLKAAGFEDGGIGNVSRPSNLVRLLTGGKEDAMGFFRNGEGFVKPEHVEVIKDLLDNIKPINNLVKISPPDMSKFASIKDSSPTINVTIPIAGNADEGTVRKLQATANSIAKQTAKEIINISRTK